MFDFFFYLLDKLKTVQVAPETPVEVWIIKSYKTLFKCHIKSQTWGESEFKGMSVEPGEYGVGNPVIIVINAINDQKITGHAIDQKKFQTLYSKIPTFSHDQVTKDMDEYGDKLREEIKVLDEMIQKLTKITSP